MRQIAICFACLSFSVSMAQTPTAAELLERSIAFHDPQGNWEQAHIELQIKMEIPDRPERSSRLRINQPERAFNLRYQSQGQQIEQGIKGDSCYARLNGQTEVADSLMKRFRLGCAGTRNWRDYYTYLYGLPMKLRDPGTLLDSAVTEETIEGNSYWVITVRYEPEVGEETWHFFLNQETYAMEAYQFYKDPKTKKGERILLKGLLAIGDLKIPQDRIWYFWPENRYLATDRLISGRALE